MNEQTLEAITAPRPNVRQKWARLIAAQCQTEHPSLRRANECYVWAVVVDAMTLNERFRLFVFAHTTWGIRKFVKLALDIWTYRLTNE